MTDADPELPSTEEDGPDTHTGLVGLLPYFLLGDSWEPDAYDETVLEWNGEAYLLECGRVHAFADEHDEHGDVLALVVVEGWDWVDECRAIAGVTEPVRV